MTGACAGNPEPLWDAYVDGEHELEQRTRQARALAICRRCPIREACAASIDLRHDDGVIGGFLLPTIHDSDRRAWTNYQPGRSGFGAILGAA